MNFDEWVFVVAIPWVWFHWITIVWCFFIGTLVMHGVRYWRQRKRANQGLIVQTPTRVVYFIREYSARMRHARAVHTWEAWKNVWRLCWEDHVHAMEDLGRAFPVMRYLGMKGCPLGCGNLTYSARCFACTYHVAHYPLARIRPADRQRIVVLLLCRKRPGCVWHMIPPDLMRYMCTVYFISGTP